MTSRNPEDEHDRRFGVLALCLFFAEPAFADLQVLDSGWRAEHVPYLPDSTLD
nr:hypothetical protein [Haloarcula amylolytica]